MTALSNELAEPKDGFSPADAPSNPFKTQPAAQPTQPSREAGHAPDPLTIAIKFMDEYADVFEELAK